MLLNWKYADKIEHIYDTSASAELTLLDQIKKVVFWGKEVESFIDGNPPKFQYIVNKQYDYNFDTLINNCSILIEYFHSYVINSLIGNSKPTRKIVYRPIKSQDDVKTMINKFKIGKLNKEHVSEDEEYCSIFEKESEKIYQDDFVSYFMGNTKVETLWVLNNYIKHNRKIYHYSPSLLYNGKMYHHIPYIYIDDKFSAHLNDSQLKSFCLYRQNPSDNELYTDQSFSKKVTNINKINNIYCVLTIDGIEFIKLADDSGVTVESILFAVYDLIKFIVNVYRKHNPGSKTELDNLDILVTEIEERTPKTIYNLNKQVGVI